MSASKYIPTMSDQERDEALRHHYTQILQLLGEDPEREGLVKTPERVSKAMRFLTQGMTQSPEEILRSAMFRGGLSPDGHRQGH